MAVRACEAFLPYFSFEVGGWERRERRDSNPQFPNIEVRPPQPQDPGVL